MLIDKLNCANKIRNDDDNGADIDDDEIKYVRSVFNNPIITYFIENNNKTDLTPKKRLYTK